MGLIAVYTTQAPHSLFPAFHNKAVKGVLACAGLRGQFFFVLRMSSLSRMEIVSSIRTQFSYSNYTTRPTEIDTS